MNVRKQAHEAGALYGGLHCTLLLGGEPRALAAQDATMRIDELLQEIDVFVINVSNVVLREDVIGHT